MLSVSALTSTPCDVEENEQGVFVCGSMFLEAMRCFSFVLLVFVVVIGSITDERDFVISKPNSRVLFSSTKAKE